MFINVGEAADIARVKKQTILLWIRKGTIKAIQHPAMQKTLIEREKFIDFIRNGYWNEEETKAVN